MVKNKPSISRAPITVKSTGFTIVELLIVIVVIAVLAAISIVAYRGITDRSYDAAVASDLKHAQQSIDLYRTTEGVYPGSGHDNRSVASEILSNSIMSMDFSDGVYSSPEVYSQFEPSVIVGYTSRLTGSDFTVLGVCLAVKSKSGQHFVLASPGVVAKTDPIQGLGSAHDFKTACSLDGQYPNDLAFGNDSHSGLTYGPVFLSDT